MSSASGAWSGWAQMMTVVVAVVGAAWGLAWSLGGNFERLGAAVERNAKAIESNAKAIESNAAAIERAPVHGGAGSRAGVGGREPRRHGRERRGDSSARGPVRGACSASRWRRKLVGQPDCNDGWAGGTGADLDHHSNVAFVLASRAVRDLASANCHRHGAAPSRNRLAVLDGGEPVILVRATDRPSAARSAPGRAGPGAAPVCGRSPVPGSRPPALGASRGGRLRRAVRAAPGESLRLPR